jgi:hypothetical protein
VENRRRKHTVMAAKASLDLAGLAVRSDLVPPIFEPAQVIGVDGATPTLAKGLLGRKASEVKPRGVHNLDAPTCAAHKR